MERTRAVMWGTALVAGGALALIDATGAFPDWLIIGPVIAGVAGLALLADRIFFAPRAWGGFYLPLLIIGATVGTVMQDAEIVVDEYAVWPFVLIGLGLAVMLEVIRGRGPGVGPTAGAGAH